jgi:PilZ domain
MAARKPIPPSRRPDTKSLTRPRLDIDFGGDEHRKFPRATMSMPVALWIERDGDRRFSATLAAENLSVSGAFLKSTFFLPVGTQLKVRFTLEAEDGDPVEARAEVVRQEHADDRSGQGRTGLAIRFIEFYEKTEVTLARLFLAERLTAFASDYLSSKRARSLNSELERVVDALAAWELLKVTQPGDVWEPEALGDKP